MMSIDAPRREIAGNTPALASAIANPEPTLSQVLCKAMAVRFWKQYADTRGTRGNPIGSTTHIPIPRPIHVKLFATQKILAAPQKRASIPR